jgi:hypothetical protein
MILHLSEFSDCLAESSVPKLKELEKYEGEVEGCGNRIFVWLTKYQNWCDVVTGQLYGKDLNCRSGNLRLLRVPVKTTKNVREKKHGRHSFNQGI